ncbi:hypothetical protein Apa02nite_074070 [Actinoplanes palleronii]|uniref:Uncharacterized protein n=1 Tax=Actinoplanes palleronii TaxID=113570 RepID=A0ABQ4BKU3_9ACTN|nr:hypothetical protein Apa02nite_074070 [Actinoplanes palleronii]
MVPSFVWHSGLLGMRVVTRIQKGWGNPRKSPVTSPNRVESVTQTGSITGFGHGESHTMCAARKAANPSELGILCQGHPV